MAERIAESAAQIGRGIRKLRKQKKWKQDVLSEFSGVNRATISQIERGQLNPSLFVLERLVKALDTDLSGVVAAGRHSLRKKDQELISLVGTNVKQFRLQLGLSRKDLGLKAGLLPQYLATTENCRRMPSVRNLQQIARALDVDPSTLLGESSGCEFPEFRLVEKQWGPGVRVAAIRKDRNLTRREVARLSGVDAYNLWKIEEESAGATLATLIALAKGLGVKVGVLID